VHVEVSDATSTHSSRYHRERFTSPRTEGREGDRETERDRQREREREREREKGLEIFSASVKGITDGNSIIRQINERERERERERAAGIILRAVADAVTKRYVTMIHSERRFPRRWEIVLNFRRGTEPRIVRAGRE